MGYYLVGVYKRINRRYRGECIGLFIYNPDYSRPLVNWSIDKYVLLLVWKEPILDNKLYTYIGE